MINKHYVLIILVILFVMLNGSLSAQVKTYGVAFGLAGGATVGDMDFGRDNQFGVTLNGFIRHSIAGPLEGQISGMTFGRLKRNDENAYETRISTADYRLLLRLFSANWASVYLFGGIGGLYYNVKEPPKQFTPEADSVGWVAVAPAGGGVQLKITDHVSLDISGGYNFTNTDDLNRVRAGKDDGYFSGMAGFTWTLESGGADPDNDGLINKLEKQLGTNKNNPDTDGDKLLDGEEFHRYQSEPLVVDTENDGLDDFVEVKNYNTNPRKADTDDDGLIDRDEVLVYTTNPLTPDSDIDGLNDYEEVMTHKTDPKKADTDGEGLKDGEEVKQYQTDPLNADTDADGLSDREEILAYKTDPKNSDTDGGTVNDGPEVKRGTDPLNADDDIILEVEEGAPIVLEGVTFATGRADITPSSAAILELAYRTMNAYPDMVVEIRGYTDNTGSRSTNIRLSQRRADSVRLWLIGRGVDSGRIIAKGYGPDNPIASNNTREGRAQNRRIEFYRIK
jgi:outer membrane protein OmpA-like peptidoglycan-associated protein